MINELINCIIDDLSIIPYFKNYKYRKRDRRFINKTIDGFNAIEFQIWDGYDLKRDCRALVVKPLYFKRFNVLHKWFEKHSFKSLSTQRDNYSIGFDGKMVGGISEFYFKIDKGDFEKDFIKFQDEIIVRSQDIFNKYRTLTDLYEIEIIPILLGGKELPNTGADWVFEYLKLCSIVDSSNYYNLKNIIIKQVEFMYTRGEPNIKEYYSNLNNILFEIENKI